MMLFSASVSDKDYPYVLLSHKNHYPHRTFKKIIITRVNESSTISGGKLEIYSKKLKLISGSGLYYIN